MEDLKKKNLFISLQVVNNIQVNNIMESHNDSVLEWDLKICLGSHENVVRLGTF